MTRMIRDAVIATLLLSACGQAQTANPATTSLAEASSTTTSTIASTTSTSVTSSTVPAPIVGEPCDAQGARSDVLECRTSTTGLVWMKTSIDGVRHDPGGDDDRCRLPDRRTEPSSAEVGLVIGFPLDLSGALTDSTGTATLAAVAVDFPDFSGTDGEIPVLREAASSFDDWLDVESGGRLDTSWQFHDQWITMSKSAAEYRVQGFGTEPYQELSTEIVDRVLEVLPLNGLDELFVYFPDSLTTSELELDIDPFAGVLAQIGIPKREIGIFESARIRNMKGSGTISKRNDNILWAIWAHEFLHALGLQAHGPEPSGLIDAAANGAFTLSAWNRWLLGWLSADELVCLDPPADAVEIDLVPLQLDSSIDGPRAVMVPLSETSAILVESHRAVGNGARLGAAGTYGVVTYLIDSDEVAPYDPFTNDESAGTRFVYPEGMLDGSRDVYGFVAQEMWDRQPLMFLGESVNVEGFTVEFVSSAGFDTVRIAPSVD